MTFYYWIAINKDSCAASSAPLPDTLQVSPRPEMFIGFPSRSEQLEAQRFLLTCPVNAIPTRLEQWRQRSDIRIIVPRSPEPPTRGETVWMVEPS
jgi:hypothetical protein